MLGYFSSLKTEDMRSSELSVEFQWATRFHIPKDRRTLQSLNLLCIVTIYIVSRDRMSREEFGLVIGFVGLLYNS
jgi:hypothetical protein